MNYFFITHEEGLLQARHFLQHLRSRWPQSQVEEIINQANPHALEFIIPMAHSQVHGSLNRDGGSVVFVGDIRDCADFALWCLSTLPYGESATFCDESMSGNLDLSATTTAADILQAFTTSS